MALFGNLFGNLFGTLFGGSSSTCYAVDVEFTELAVELIDEFIETPNAVWNSISDNSVADENKPFEVGKPTVTTTNVKLLFVRDDLEDRQFLRYVKKTAMVDGQINAYMYEYTGLNPKLKDTVSWNGKTLTVNAIDPIQPIDKVILYFIEFGS